MALDLVTASSSSISIGDASQSHGTIDISSMVCITVEHLQDLGKNQLNLPERAGKRDPFK